MVLQKSKTKRGHPIYCKTLFIIIFFTAKYFINCGLFVSLRKVCEILWNVKIFRKLPSFS